MIRKNHSIQKDGTFTSAALSIHHIMLILKISMP